MGATELAGRKDTGRRSPLLPTRAENLLRARPGAGVVELADGGLPLPAASPTQADGGVLRGVHGSQLLEVEDDRRLW